MFYVLLYAVLCRSSIAIILMGKRELVALLNLSSWCLVMVERLFFTVPQDSLRFVIVVFPDHTHLLFYCILASFEHSYTFLQLECWFSLASTRLYFFITRTSPVF